MLTSEKQISIIAREVMEKEYDFEYIGLRVQCSDYRVSIGEKVEHQSRHWIDGIMTEEETGGICAVDARAAAVRVLRFGNYDGGVILVLGSNYAEYGEDDGEIIMKRNPVIVNIIHLSQYR